MTRDPARVGGSVRAYAPRWTPAPRARGGAVVAVEILRGAGGRDPAAYRPTDSLDRAPRPGAVPRPGCTPVGHLTGRPRGHDPGAVVVPVGRASTWPISSGRRPSPVHRTR